MYIATTGCLTQGLSAEGPDNFKGNRTLSFDNSDLHVLKLLQSELAALRDKYKSELSITGGLIKRPVTTLSVVIARRLKCKYKQLQHIKSLKTQCQVGRPWIDTRIQNRVGQKVAKLWKVCVGL